MLSQKHAHMSCQPCFLHCSWVFLYFLPTNQSRDQNFMCFFTSGPSLFVSLKLVHFWVVHVWILSIQYMHLVIPKWSILSLVFNKTTLMFYNHFIINLVWHSFENFPNHFILHKSMFWSWRLYEMDLDLLMK